MANETNDQPEQQDEQAAAKIEQVFAAMGQAMRALSQEQHAIRGTLTQMIDERAQIVQLMERLSAQFGIVSENQLKGADAIVALGNLGRAMDDRITLLMKLLDMHHETLIRHGMANPRPEPGLAN